MPPNKALTAWFVALAEGFGSPKHREELQPLPACSPVPTRFAGRATVSPCCNFSRADTIMPTDPALFWMGRLKS